MESENKTFDEMKPGEVASLVRTLTHKDIELFGIMSGDVNPTHVDDAFARSACFHKVVAHGTWSGALISTLLGAQLPGSGTVYVDQSLHFKGPIGLGDTITVTVKVRNKVEQTHRVIFDCVVVNQNGKEVVTGTAEVIAPTDALVVDRVRDESGYGGLRLKTYATVDGARVRVVIDLGYGDATEQVWIKSSYRSCSISRHRA
jgi:acyl dehydratase